MLRWLTKINAEAAAARQKLGVMERMKGNLEKELSDLKSEGAEGIDDRCFLNVPPPHTFLRAPSFSQRVSLFRRSTMQR